MKEFQIEDWFSTPIAYGFLPFEIDSEIIDFCLSAKEQNSNTQVWSCNTYNSFLQQELLKNPIFNPIKKYLLSQVKLYVRDLGCESPIVEELNGWFSIAEKDHYQEVHIHDQSHISVVLYLQANTNSGDIIFIDKYFDMNPIPRTSNLKYNGPKVFYQPETKKFLIFKSNTPHMVDRNKTNFVRISLSLNYRIT
jgi:uncharacterized protein (TIGR02466 family)